MRLQAGFLRAAHHGTQEDGFELAAVIGEMAMRLAEHGNDLRHLQTEFAVLVGERRAVALRLMLLTSTVCAQIWMRCPAIGVPSPARRTVPHIQKPPLPIRSTTAAPLR